ncbi:hypothetical protein L9F63_022707 [Diploptera punctata]|uniref:Endonuclease-reverse transcriptase n=1 Tax=Diploptera punctata TaxID=6984 RepID=A0AAD7ZM90_DIPPU|nr:hypothetical protein L9F63_022707 [Diploptera punctata]
MDNIEGIGKENIKRRIELSSKIISSLNSTWWDKHFWKDTKKYIGKTLVESVTMYGSEVWTINKHYKNRLIALEMDYLRRSARKSKLEHVTNNEIRNIMEAEENIIERIEEKKLKWLGHVLRMEDERWPKQLYQWHPTRRRKRGRQKLTWKENMKTLMQARGLSIEDAQDHRLWRFGTGRWQQL